MSGEEEENGEEEEEEEDGIGFRTNKIHEIMEQSTSEDSKKTIRKILAEVHQLPDVEKLLLYLQLPTGSGVPVDANKQLSANPLGNRFEITQTVTWIKTHLEEDPEVSLPKHEIYEEYCMFFGAHKMKPLSTADFGKVMKQAFPNVRPRRLGTRGNSRYCYSGLRKKMELDPPKLPTVDVGRDGNQGEALSLRGLSEEIISACSYVILDWAFKILDQKFESLKDLACYLVQSNVVDIRSVGAFTILSQLQNNKKGNQAPTLLTQAGGNKHREMQLQLQRKLQEKELIREQRRKSQEIKTERQPTKERRRAASGPCSRAAKHSARAGLSQPATPLPQQSHEQVNVGEVVQPTDKGAAKGLACLNTGEAQLPANRGEKQVPVCVNNSVNQNRPNGDGRKIANKVQIPRMPSNRQSPKVCLASPSQPLHSLIIVPPLAQAKPKSKYKPIQPKPSSSSSSSFEESQQSAMKRSADEKLPHSRDSSPKKALLELRKETPTGEPIIEDSHIDRVACSLFAGDAATGEAIFQESLNDFVDGSSASLDQDEELSQYFNEGNPKAVGDLAQSAQISQLRRLLENNLKPSLLATPSRGNAQSHTLRELLTLPSNQVQQNPKEEPNLRSTCVMSGKLTSGQGGALPPVEELTGYSLAQQSVDCSPMSSSANSPMMPLGSVAARRRVSFPSTLVMPGAGDGPSSVPPSPTTRVRALNFTPISPRHTPVQDGFSKSTVASQPASATASPFVSPRSTPIPQSRSRHNSGQAPSSSFGTTPRSTPYPPSEQSSTAPSPFISPHATPVPFSRSRHNSNQNLVHRQTTFFPQSTSCTSHIMANPSRSRHSSGATLALLSPCSAPLSPMGQVLDSETVAHSHFFLPTVGDTPQMRSRHSSSSSVPPQSPRSAPMSPQAAPPSTAGATLSNNFQVDSESSDWAQSWMSNRQRHASQGATVHHLPAGVMLSGQGQQLEQDLSSLTQRSQSVPLYQMLQNDLMQTTQDNQQFSQSYPATPAATLAQAPPFLPLAQGLSSENYSPYIIDSPGLDGNRLSDLFSSGPSSMAANASDSATLESRPPSVPDDLQTTWEDLRECDNEFQKFAQELELSNGNGGSAN